MSADIPEADWKRFKEIHSVLLERFCNRILGELMATCQLSNASAHDRYLKVYKLIKERDKQVASAFNDFRRSTAVLQLAIMRRMKLLKDEELQRFSEATQNRIRAFESL